MGNKHSHGVGTDTERRRRRRSTPLNGQDSSLFPLSEDLLQRAETGVFSDSESEQSIESESDSDISDTQSDDGVWMVLPSALNPTGTTIRKVATQVLDQEEQLQLVKRRVQATRSQPVQINYQDKSRGSSGNVDVSTQDAVDDEAISPTNFQRIKVIGVGGMGRVLLVRYRRDGKLYAMKVVSKRSVRKKDMAARVLSERDVLGGTCHHALGMWFFMLGN
ncbi:hypothetical protein PHYBOEH_011537 [Phytophthora boehmeriae]|uniref:non-specific serine/threonine protein kinase n=1 Tax=Phytophthora boehmeriae TaxID=109152 RepID=A0A8T1VJ50_9STRA|nr:hypothetical protein PHYBOEH_011537 [Phytophthora boehmeriae]